MSPPRQPKMRKSTNACSSSSPSHYRDEFEMEQDQDEWMVDNVQEIESFDEGEERNIISISDETDETSLNVDVSDRKRNAFDVLLNGNCQQSGSASVSATAKKSKTTSTSTASITQAQSTLATQTVTQQQQEGSDFPPTWKFLKKYFEYVDRHTTKKGLSYTGKCLVCQTNISADKSSTTNFKRHYKLAHDQILFADITDNDGSRSTTLQSKKLIQIKLRESLEPIHCQDQLARKVSRTIYKGFHPFSMVEEEDFVSLIQCCLKSDVNGKEIYVPSRKQVVQILEKDYEVHEKLLKNTLKEVEFVAVTADVWKSKHEAFLGMTAHWIADDFSRKSAVLVLKRMEFEITFKEIGMAINDTLTKYGILEKTVMATTDNGSNFIKSFRVYGEENDQDLNPIHSKENDAEYDFVEVFAAMNQHDNDIDVSVQLPPHHRCSSHTLNLIMQTDSEKFDDSTERTIMLANGTTQVEKIQGVFVEAKKRAFKLCKSIWTLQNKATKNSDYVKRVLGKYLPVPNDTRWNSFYVAVKEIVKQENLEKIKIIGQKLGVYFEDRDFCFLGEYCDVMEPLANALDILQGEHKMYFGILLPTIYVLRRRLENFKNLRYCNDFAKFLTRRLNNRFQRYWVNETYLVASALLPPFKNLSNWIRNEEIEKTAADAVKLIMAACHNNHDRKKQSRSSDSTSTTKVSKFFEFLDDEEAAAEDCGYDKFLADCSGMTVLNKYPCLKILFIQYNTALPSSAAVERLFSIGGDIMTKKRHKLTDEHFEQQLKLKTGIS